MSAEKAGHSGATGLFDPNTGAGVGVWSDDAFRVVVRSADRPTRAHYLEPGATMTIGRGGDLTLGLDPHDPGISRIALSVTATPDGWRLSFTNRNGAMLHEWAQAAEWIAYNEERFVRWPRVGVRLVGDVRDLEHWILLETDALPLPGRSPQTDPVGDEVFETQVSTRPRELTPSQLLAVYAIFPEHLAWPPRVSPVSRSLEAAAHRIGVTPSAIRERLRPVQDRARELGFPQTVGVTEPEYVYHLAAHGYLTEVPPPVPTESSAT